MSVVSTLWLDGIRLHPLQPLQADEFNLTRMRSYAGFELKLASPRFMINLDTRAYGSLFITTDLWLCLISPCSITLYVLCCDSETIPCTHYKHVNRKLLKCQNAKTKAAEM